MLTADDALDIIDIYGPNSKDWPGFARSDMDALIASDEDVAAYLKRQKIIDDMLNGWEEDKDGARIEDDDLERSDEEQWPDMDDEELDEPAQPETSEDSDEQDEDQSGEGDEETDEDEQSGGGDESDQDEDFSIAPPEDDYEDEDEGYSEPLPPLDVDPNDISDMDEMFEAKIKAFVDESADGQFNVFSRDRDGFVDIKVPEGTTLEPIDQAVARAVGPLMKDLRRMIAARSQVRRIPGKRSGKLHAASLHRIKLGDDRVFSRKEEAQSLNTAITLLIDCSGSMSGGSLRLATETAYALATVLNKLGIAFEAIGFADGWAQDSATPEEIRQWQEEAFEASKEHPLGRMQPLMVPKFKAFEDRWTIPVQQRFAAVFDDEYNVQMGSTPEGCGLEFAAKRLLQRSEDRKILMCMTDGEPMCFGYNQTGAKEKSDYQHSKDMVKSIELAGIDIVGIGIDHDGPTRYYPRSLVIHNVEEMPKLLMGVLKQFILG
jgi:cobalamin biosynthesis protein CobT